MPTPDPLPADPLTDALPAVAASDVAAAFALGPPLADLTLVQHTSSRTWRLRVRDGDFLVKELWPGDDPAWAAQVEGRLAFERRAAAAGIQLPATVMPRRPVFGCAARLGGRGAYRLTEWLPHRKATPDDDLSDWLGRTLTAIHSLEPSNAVPEPHWYVRSPGEWHAWADTAAREGRLWAPALAERVTGLVALTDRLRAAHLNATDGVITHRDLIPANVLLTAAGPVLVDWEVVGPDSAALETGFAAAAFAGDDPARVRRVLDAYRAHGRTLPVSDETDGIEVFAHAVGAPLGRLAELVDGVLSGAPLTGWRAAHADPDGRILRLMDKVAAAAARFHA